MTEDLDKLVASYERKWGVDRLTRLVSPATLLRFNQAVAMGEVETTGYCSPERRAALDAMMMRAWAALDAEATAAGHQPMPPAWREIDLRTEGRGICAIADMGDEHAQTLILRAKAEGRLVEVWTLAEVARVMQVHSIVGAAKREFPGAYVTTPPATHGSSYRRKAGPGDDLSDIMPLPEEIEHAG